MATWDPAQYLTFGDHRLRPALELLARIPVDAPGRVVDLGCGPGNITKFLRARWPEAKLVGVDNSAEMLAAAAKAEPDATWEVADFTTWQPAEPVDVIYANAALQWGSDHATLFPRLMQCVAPGGVLAVQMPRNFGEPSHTSMQAAAAAGPWQTTLERLERRDPVAEPDFYYDALAPHATRLDIWETRYQQVLTGENPVAEFTKGSWLRPFLEALQEPERSGFENAYRALILKAYPPRQDGTTLFPFKRLFIVAQR